MQLPMYVYSGQRNADGTTTVTRDGERLEDCLRFLRVLTEYPRWDWGCQNRGAVQLAYALLVDNVSNELASVLAARFADQILRKLQPSIFQITRGCILLWVGTLLVELENEMLRAGE